MPILVQRSRRPRRWAGVASFAALLLAMWWNEHDAGPMHAPPPDTTAEAAQHPPAPTMLSGLGPSFSAEPLAALPEPQHD